MKKDNKKVNLEALEREIRALSKEDRAELFVRLGLPKSHRPYGIIKGLDIDEFIRAERLNDLIRIDDMVGEYKQKPRITIKSIERRLKLANNSDFETIDIFACISNNPAAIGHPLILFVIQRWIAIARYYRVLSKEHSSWLEMYKIAEVHLQRLGCVLLETAKESDIQYEYARIHLYKQDFKERPKYGVLFAAWNLLTQNDIKNTRNNDLKLKKMKEYLCGLEYFLDYAIDEVITFFRKNRRFVSQRRSWVATSKAYEAWNLSLDQATLRRYNTKANKQGSRLQGVRLGPPASEIVTVSDIANAIGDWFSALSY